MDDWRILLPTLVIGYLFGSLSFARIVFARLRPGQSPPLIRMPSKDGQAELVSHAIGATNVMLVFGARWGMFVTALDILKGFLPVLALRLVFPEASYHLVAGVAILVGHLFPVWYRFSGGGGNSSIIGMVLAVSPLGVLATHGVGMMVGRVLPMFAFLGGIVLTIPWFMVRNGPASPEALFAIAITVVYMTGQLPEIIKVVRMKRAGHPVEVSHVMDTMKRSVAAGKPDKPEGSGT